MRSTYLTSTAAAIGLISGFSGIARAEADGLTDALGPREIAVGDALRATATGASSALLNPAALAQTRELVFEGGYGYRATDAASVFAVAACDSTPAVPGCIYYNLVSASPTLDGMEFSRKAHTAGITLSKALSSRISIGGAVKYFNVSPDMPGEGKVKGFNWDVGLAAQLSEMIRLGVVGYNLYGQKAEQFPRAAAAGASLQPLPRLTASFDMLWNLVRETDQLRYGGGLEYYFSSQRGQTAWPIRAGAVHESAGDATYVSGGVGVATMKYGLDLGVRRQIRGGDDLAITAGLRFYPARDPIGGN